MPQTPAQLYAAGLTAYRATSFEIAIDLFTEAIELGTRSAKLFDARASAYERLGRTQEGLHDAREVVKLMPGSHKGYLRAAKTLGSAREWAKAEKVLKQGLERVAATEEKGRAELEKELAVVSDERAKAEHSPLSNLPLELFLHIIQLATPSPSCNQFTSSETPRSKPPRVNTLFSAMRVCRTWHRLIKGTPALYETLSLDGVINGRNSERKMRWILERSGGVVQPDEKGGSSGKAARGRTLLLEEQDNDDVPPPPRSSKLALRHLVLTAAQDFTPQAFNLLLSSLLSAVPSSSSCSPPALPLRSVVISFVDGSQTTLSAALESTRATQLLTFLHDHSRSSLISLSICSRGRVYPDFDLASAYCAFPSLQEFRLCGATTSNFVFGLRAPFLRHSPAVAATAGDNGASSNGEDAVVGTFPPSPAAKHLTILGAVLDIDSSLSRTSFPALDGLELDTLNATVIWDLLSCPSLSKYRAVVYGETQVMELDMPDLTRAWDQVENLKLGGAKRFAPRLLDHAVSLNLSFPFLRHLDLSFASLSTSHLSALFSSTSAPLLSTLILASTTCASPSRSLSLPSQLHSLKHLNVSHTLWTTDETLRELARGAPMLEKLEVRGNAFITGRPVMELVRARFPPLPVEGEEQEQEQEQGRRYSLLTSLSLEGCTKLETPAVEWLRKNVRPGGARFQFLNPGEKKQRGANARWEWGMG